MQWVEDPVPLMDGGAMTQQKKYCERVTAIKEKKTDRILECFMHWMLKELTEAWAHA